MESYDVVVCGNCGLIYADNIPPQAAFNRYYSTMSKYEFNNSKGLASRDYIEKYKKIVNFLTAYIGNRDVKILDIGCSTGGLLSIFKLNGYSDLLGIDPSVSCVRSAEGLYSIKATVNNISNFEINEKFDLIIFSAVLEHLVDFTDGMLKARSLLNDGGLLFIDVPDAERFGSYISAPFQQFSVEHINYFSQYSIKNVLSRFSFKTLDIEQNENKIHLATDPDIFILSEKMDRTGFKIARDDTSEPRVRNYITQCSKLDADVAATIHAKLSNKNKVIVWGVGTHTQRLVGSALDLSKILFFVDSNARYAGKKLRGIEIKSPEDIRDEKIPILISTYAYQQEIAHHIKEVLKLDNEILKIY